MRATPMRTGTDVVRRRRPAPAVALCSALVVALAAACGGNGPSDASGSPTAHGSSTSAVAYSACMRVHGVPSYPDPDSSGRLPKGDAPQFGVSESRYQAAEQACRPLLPPAESVDDQVRECTLNGACTPALLQQMMDGGRIFARCMRAHGVPTWPDPTLGGPHHTPFFPVADAGLSRDDTHSERVTSRGRECLQEPGAVMLPTG